MDTVPYSEERYRYGSNQQVDQDEQEEEASGLADAMMHHPTVAAIPRLRSISLNSRPTSAHYRLMQQEGIQMLTVAGPAGSSLTNFVTNATSAATGTSPPGSGQSLSGSGTLATKGLGSGNLEDIRRGRKRTMSSSIRIGSASPVRARQKIWSTTHFSTAIGDYDLISHVGVVDDISWMYYGKHTPTGEDICLKLTDLTLTTDSEFLDELISSVKNMSRVRHRCILPYMASFIENERLWSVTSPVRLGSVRSLMKQYHPKGFPEEVVATILREVVLGVDYLHSCGFIHNDIRADNIMLDTTGEIRLTGLHQMTQLNENGQIRKNVFSFVGDAEWMSPEVMTQGSLHSEKVDMYSIGITALELLYGRTPYENWPPLKILLYKIKYDGVPPIDIPKKLTKSVLKMIDLCLRKDPRQRPTAKELLDSPFFKQAKSASMIKAFFKSAENRQIDPSFYTQPLSRNVLPQPA